MNILKYTLHILLLTQSALLFTMDSAPAQGRLICNTSKTDDVSLWNYNEQLFSTYAPYMTLDAKKEFVDISKKLIAVNNTPLKNSRWCGLLMSRQSQLLLLPKHCKFPEDAPQEVTMLRVMHAVTASITSSFLLLPIKPICNNKGNELDLAEQELRDLIMSETHKQEDVTPDQLN